MPELNTATLDKMVTAFFVNGRQPSLSVVARPFSADDLLRKVRDVLDAGR